MKDYNQVDFDWSGDNTAEAREEAGKELVRFLERQAKFIEEGEEITIIAHSHGGNVVKYASRDLKSLLDRVIFMATPHRTDAKFNFKSMKKGGKVFNVYDRGDYFVQQWGGSVDSNRADEQWKEYGEVVLKKIRKNIPDAKQTMNGAENIAIGVDKPQFLKTKERNIFEDALEYGATTANWYIYQFEKHTTIHTPEKWNRHIAPRIAK